MDDIIAKQQAILAIIDCEKEYLTPAQIAPVLGVDPHAIRIVARRKPELLKFEFEVVGNRTKIPRIPFLRYIGVKVDDLVQPEEKQQKGNAFEYKPMTNEELLLAITLQFNEFKQEISERLDHIEHRSQDLDNVLKSARDFINALTGKAVDK